ncbi:hypothetical protein TRFO_07214 [Tritrichomonas foetus]|uniref:Uncharacterized protein n=1 Tax=Tritrichomonas foetus TaxID=1144522 RepID=A0A1J4JXU3_9EUKA|nr:hypothetical protein TRFO_07214 [Tritrichomonas foetus]|eukprot:OHT02356.1 hypothetical protein TRFO_07214 [Tritrichomonas foetus]
MLSCAPVEAYRWWNSNINPFGEVDLPPKIASPKEASLVWSKFFPIFDLIAPESVSYNLYWKSILSILSHFRPSKDIPSPFNNFPEFIVFLYNMRTIITPRNLTHCFQFLETYQYRNFAQFIIYEMPLYFHEPVLYLKSILELCDSSHALWNKIITQNAVCDAFFYMNANFLQPLAASSDSIKWSHHLILGEIIFRLLISTLRNNSTSLTNSNKFCDYLVRMIPSAPTSVKITATRWILTLTKRTLKKGDKDVLKTRIKNFLPFVKMTPYIFHYSIIYIRDNLISLTSPNKLLNTISVDSLFNIELILSFSKKIGPMAPLTKLSKGALASKIWHRAAFQAACEIIQTYSNENELKDWLTIYIRRLFIFVSLSNLAQKYKTRALLVTESLSKLLYLRINWIRQLVLNISYTINATRSTPPYFSAFFPSNSSNDEPTFGEFEAFQRVNSLINLKTFPFDGRKATFIPPPALDNSNPATASSSSIGPLPPMPPQNPLAHRGHLQAAKSNRRIQTKKAGKKKPVIKKPTTTKHIQHFKT